MPVELEEALRDALGHLYDPSYQPAELLWTVTGCDPQRGPAPLRALLTAAVEGLRPSAAVPPAARARRLYDLLAYRYLQDHTQEETAERLGITSRHLRREQQEAIALLARELAAARGAASPESQPPALPAGESASPPEARPAPETVAEWRSQVQQDVAALQKNAPGTVADVEQALSAALELGRALIGRRALGLAIEDCQPGLVAAIHPSALRQVLLTAIGNLADQMADGAITCRAGWEAGQIVITLAGRPAAGGEPPDASLLRELVGAAGGSLGVETSPQGLSFVIQLVPMEEIPVLVVDDNLDLVHFYERYTANTRYRIAHVGEGKQVMETVAASRPGIIVLDVMLPDMDGWQLLSYLHEDPTTRSIPVLVCSVIQQPELALALGAALCLAKPVRRGDLIAALDQISATLLAASTPKNRERN